MSENEILMLTPNVSESALSRINHALPDGVRLFSGTRVRGRFDARDQASARVYEYLLPCDSLMEVDGSMDKAVEELDPLAQGGNIEHVAALLSVSCDAARAAGICLRHSPYCHCDDYVV